MGGGHEHRAPRRCKASVVVALVAVLAAGLVLLGAVGISLVERRVFGPSAAELERPPSERHRLASRRSEARPVSPSGGHGASGAPTQDTTASQDTTAPTTSTPDLAPQEERYEELRCTFSGRAILDPGLPFSLFESSPQSMRLAAGAHFECEGPPRPTSGEVEMSADFDDLGLFSGLGRGDGRMTWKDLPGDAGPAPDGAAVSSTDNEIELLYPEIVVWVSIVEGPYAGFRGKLVLADWERVEDEEGRIVEIVFNPTTVTFSPA